MLNIVIPMAGYGSRFSKVGYTLPKPLIPVHNQPMIQLVINNLRPEYSHRFIFICQQEHIDKFDLRQKLHEFAANCEVLTVDQVTEGAACTVLLAKSFIANENPLMIANCDQWIDININDYLDAIDKAALDGFIMTMKADSPKWSYIRFNDHGEPCEVVEKQVVSDEATVGIYNYRSGADFVTAAESMIAKNFRVNNEFYVAPVYNEMIAKSLKIGYYNIGTDTSGMYGLGTPDDLEKFLANPPKSLMSMA
jgi:NDP-sugar pyrophosphorylase family protein